AGSVHTRGALPDPGVVPGQALRVPRGSGGGTIPSASAPCVSRLRVHALLDGAPPSEASGLQWGDLDLRGRRLHVQRSRHLYEYGAPKTSRAERWVELFPQHASVLQAILPLRVAPEMPMFVTTTGSPIEPKILQRALVWYRCLRSLGIRQRGLYCTKDT